MHVVAMPAVWLPAAYLSTVYYGDEYGAFAVANLPALGVLTASGLMGYVNSMGSMPAAMVTLVAVGAAVMAALGGAMGALGVRRRAYPALVPLWALGVVVLHVLVNGGVRRPPSPWPRSPTYYQEIATVAYAWACYALALGSIAVAGGAILLRRVRRRASLNVER